MWRIEIFSFHNEFGSPNGDLCGKTWQAIGSEYVHQYTQIGNGIRQSFTRDFQVCNVQRYGVRFL